MSQPVMSHTLPPTALDVSAWVGAYPFRGIDGGGIADLDAKMKALGIVGAVVSPLEGVFWENNLDAYRRWRDRVAEFESMELWPVVNPAQPGQLEELEELLSRRRPRGLRLTPNYHGYRLTASVVGELMALAKRYGVIVQVFHHLADTRWHWMLHTPPVELDDLAHLASVYPDQPILISALPAPQQLADRVNDAKSLWLDLSGLRGPVFAVERLLASVPAERLLFGSLWPVQIIEATLWQLWDAPIPVAARDAILHENFGRLTTFAPSTQPAAQAQSERAGKTIPA